MYGGGGFRGSPFFLDTEMPSFIRPYSSGSYNSLVLQAFISPTISGILQIEILGDLSPADVSLFSECSGSANLSIEAARKAADKQRRHRSTANPPLCSVGSVSTPQPGTSDSTGLL